MHLVEPELCNVPLFVRALIYGIGPR